MRFPIRSIHGYKSATNSSNAANCPQNNIKLYSFVNTNKLLNIVVPRDLKFRIGFDIKSTSIEDLWVSEKKSECAWEFCSRILHPAEMTSCHSWLASRIHERIKLIAFLSWINTPMITALYQYCQQHTCIWQTCQWYYSKHIAKLSQSEISRDRFKWASFHSTSGLVLDSWDISLPSAQHNAYNAKVTLT